MSDPKAASRNRSSLETLARWCDRFSPRVGIASPDCLLLEIGGLEHLFGSDRALAERIRRELAQQGIASRIAVADTLGAAWALANSEVGSRMSDVKGSKDGAQGLFDFRHPTFELVFVPAGETARALHPLPVALLRLPDAALDLLRQLGIRQIGQLAVLPRAELSARLGPEVIRRLDQAYGRLDEPLPNLALPPELSVGQPIEYPSPRRESLEPVLAELVQRVVKELTTHGLGALRVDCRLECAPGQWVALGVGLFQPTAAVAHLQGLLAMQLERAVIPGPVSHVQLEVSMAAPLTWRQQEMFGEASGRDRARHLAALVERLSARLGPQAVTRPRWRPDAQPELAYTGDPLVAGGPRQRRTTGCNVPTDLPPRPLRLLARPAVLQAVASLAGGPPLRLRFGDQDHQIAHSWGPERIETGWWRGRAVGRDYYRVETHTGQRFWLFRRLADGRWFLHGMFE